MSNLSIDDGEDLPQPFETPSSSEDEGIGNYGASSSNMAHPDFLAFAAGVGIGNQQVVPKFVKEVLFMRVFLFFFVRSVTFSSGAAESPDCELLVACLGVLCIVQLVVRTWT